MRNRLRLPSAGTFLGLLALFVALGGPATAQEAAVSAKRALTGKDIKDRSLGLKELSPAARRALRGQRGAKGDKGDAGASGAPGGQGPKGDPGTNGANGADAVLKRTFVPDDENEDIVVGAPGNDFQLVEELGSFVKDSASTTLKISYAAHLTASSASCAFQLRVDDKNAQGSDSLADSKAGGFDGFEAITGSSSLIPGFVNSYFSGLSAGTHTVELYVRALNAVTCSVNSGNYFEQKAVVEELRV